MSLFPQEDDIYMPCHLPHSGKVKLIGLGKLLSLIDGTVSIFEDNHWLACIF